MLIFKVLACDYDGTLASEDRLGPEVLVALRKAREVGLRPILVTGRTFFELTRVCEHLDLFDGVVAENGGVLYFPWSRTIVTTVGDLGRNLAGAGLALFALFFFYRHGSALLSQIERATHRLAGKRVHAMLLPLGQTVRAVTYGMLLTALAQGALATLGYWVAGLGAPVLLGAATTLLALVPFGAPIVYVPVSAWLLVQGRPLAGLLLLAWGILVVSTVDNLIRSWFISGTTRVPFLLVFLGVLGGLATFGAIGLFVGPVTITLLLVLWREWTEAGPAGVDAP